jgi:energy-coupling factor transporter ATP-binding protein EcfA2
MEPKVLLLDEPFGALDALTRAHLQDSVMAIHQKLGNTVLMITHDVDEAVLLSDRIVMMTNGPAARIGEIPRRAAAAPEEAPRTRRRRDLPKVPPARARVPLRAPSLRRSKPEQTMSGDFSPEQKRYLEGFTSGLQIARAGRGLSGGKPAAPAPTGPDAEHLLAQDRTVAAGGKLSEQEKIKREQHPFDAYSRLKEQADKNEFPKPADTFRWKYYGLFYVSPAQNSYMCRLRMPNGILKHWQLSGLADLAERFGGGYSHVTTRANLQIRDIEAKTP